MRWKGREESSNVEDRRGGGLLATGGRPMAVGGGCGTIILVLILSAIFKVSPLQLLENIGQLDEGSVTTEQVESRASSQDPNDEVGAFVRTLLSDTEIVWTDVLKKQTGRDYEPPRLVLFSGQTSYPGGTATAATGPFYLPYDRTVYLDTSFFDEMRNRFHAGGDFAYAYVLAHEVGHHVQNLLGFTNKVHSQQNRISKAEYNRLSVRLELQADFLAGVWANHAEQKWNILEAGDVEEALTAANAIGDDRLQKQARGYVVPDAFTHGTSKQRIRWFTKGLKSGRLQDGDTFSPAYESL